ncbi:MAG: hypothetical protein ABFE07_29660 [Armatimonadia bacterium]
MTNPMSIYFSKAAQAALEDRYTSNRSELVSRIIERYAEVCSRSMPRFSEAEWAALDKAYAGWNFNTGGIAYAHLCLDPDALADDLESEASVDIGELEQKLCALAYAERLAMADALERRRVAKMSAPGGDECDD